MRSDSRSMYTAAAVAHPESSAAAESLYVGVKLPDKDDAMKNISDTGNIQTADARTEYERFGLSQVIRL